MAGWVKWEKDLETDPRFVRLVRHVRGCVTPVTQASRNTVTDRLPPELASSISAGCLLRLWAYADTHIRSDDRLDLGMDDIDDVVGLPGFASGMPEDWLVKIDEATVELPNFQEHNGVSAKKRALEQKRQERRRVTQQRDGSVTGVTQQRDGSVTRPDQDQDQEDIRRPEPTGTGGSDPKLEQQILDAYHELLPELPRVREWNDRRKRKLRARIRERAHKGADQVDYWQKLFGKAAKSDFLTGRKTDWRCPGLEWLLDPKNFTKLIEGAYDNNGNG